jgi:ABC-type transporter Mla subunit MlaD
MKQVVYAKWKKGEPKMTSAEQPESSSTRLDMIEAILLQTAQQQRVTMDTITQLTTKVDRNTDAIAQLTTKADRNTDAIAQLTTKVDRNTDAIAQLTTKVDRNTDDIVELKRELQDSISHLVGIIGDFAQEAHNDREQAERDRLELREQAERDRLEFREQAERDRQVFQAEIRRIWEYLFRQGNNGNAPPNL